MDALRCPPGDADVTKISGGEKRRVALCRLLLSQARHAAARRADQPPRRRERRVARAACSRTSRARSSRSRTIATSSTTSRSGSSSSIAARAIPFEGNYSGWLELKAKRAEGRGEARRTRAARCSQRELEWVRLSPKARQAKSKARLNRYEEMVAEAQKEKRDASLEIVDPAGPAPRRRGRRVRGRVASRSAIAC